MATVSGTFGATGQSANLAVYVVGEDITYSLTGTWVGTVRLERELNRACTALRSAAGAHL